MMEKEIVSAGKRGDILIRFNKSDDAKLGKVFILYPEELEELQNQIAEANKEIAMLKLHNGDTDTIANVYDIIKKLEDRMTKLEDDVSKLK